MRSLLAALDAGAEDAREEDGELVIYTDPKELHAVLQSVKDAGLTVNEAKLSYVPSSEVVVADKDTAGKILRLFDAIDDSDDVVDVHSNADIQADM